MITQDNLARMKKRNFWTIEQLKELGFHIGEIAYFIKTGRLVNLKDGYYGNPSLLEKKNAREFQNESSQSFEPRVFLSLLQDETKKFEINTHDSDWQLLEEKSRILEQTKGIVILRAMSKERRHKIYKFIRGIPCLVAFPIDIGFEKRRVVLKFHIDAKTDIHTLLKEGNEAYYNQEFRLCIKKYLKVLNHLKNPRAYIYAKLGLSYMQIFQHKKAIDYLVVASELYQKEDKDVNFSELIDALKRKNSKKEDKKFSVPFEESEFKMHTYEDYGLEKIEEMATLVSSGRRIEEVASKFFLTEEQITILMLLFARNCYINANDSLGDKYLKMAEKRKQKTAQAKQLLNEIRKNKKLYRYQKNEEVKTFLLTR